MATFYVIRYNRDLMISELFPTLYGAGLDPDRVHAAKGSYQGKYPDVPFEEARFMTSKQADKVIRDLVRSRFPIDVMDKIAIEIQEPL